MSKKPVNEKLCLPESPAVLGLSLYLSCRDSSTCDTLRICGPKLSCMIVFGCFEYSLQLNFVVVNAQKF